MGLRVHGYAVPPVQHRDEPQAGPNRRLIAVVWTTGMAGGTQRDDPARIVPFCRIEDVACDRSCTHHEGF